MTISVTGFPASDPIPAIKLNVLLGQGTRSPGTGPRRCIMVAQRGYAEGGAAGGAAVGTATDAQLYPVYSAEDAATLWGRGSNIYRAALTALNAWRGLTLYGISPARGTATHGTAAFVLGAGPVTAGNWTIYIGDALPVVVPATAGEVVDDFGARIESYIDAATHLPVWFTYTAGTNTMDMYAKSPGADCTGIKYRIDTGTTGVTSDGAATDSGALAAGVDGTLGWTAACDAVQASDIRFTYVLPTVFGATTGLSAIEAMIEDSATADYGRRMNAVIGENGTSTTALATADTLDSGTVAPDEGAFRFQIAWASYNEAQPWELAAAVLGLRAEAESSNVNAN